MINNIVDFARMSACNLITPELHNYEKLFDSMIPRICLGLIYEASVKREKMEKLVEAREHIDEILAITSAKAAESSVLMFEYASAHAVIVAIRAELDDEVDMVQVKACVDLIKQYGYQNKEINQ